MDNDIATFLAFTGTEDAATAKQFLEVSGNNVEYAVQLFMESGNNKQADEEMAQKLQEEAYQDQVRDADATVHRHETLLDSFPQQIPSREVDIYGTGRVGIFNQRFDMEDSNSSYDRATPFEESEEEYSDEVMELDDDDLVRPTRRIQLERNRMSELTSTQKRLAELFKPPFDLIDRISLDQAKIKGRSELKWILVNIQNQAEFVCQMLNRDFWANADVKRAVKADFIFLQYQHDSVNGANYSNFYSVDSFPHIAILDPMTGERVYKWKDGEVPVVEDWLSDVALFLEKFSLQPNANNPMVHHEVRFDPDAMSEEQQIEFAMRQSVQSGADPSNAISVDSDEEPLDVHETQNQQSLTQQEQNPFDKIKPMEHTEPTSGSVTRIQFRFPGGKRLIHKFDCDSDTVGRIYLWLKHVLSTDDSYGIAAGDTFTMSSVGTGKLLDMDQTVGEAGLKNATVLLEKE